GGHCLRDRPGHAWGWLGPPVWRRRPAVVVADAVEQRAEELVRLKVDSVRNLLWTPLLRRATRRELTPGLASTWQPTGKCPLGAGHASDASSYLLAPGH